MCTEAFNRCVLGPIRVALKSAIRVPDGPSWDFDESAAQIVLTLPAESLSGNLQDRVPASPSYLFCLGYWLELIAGHPINCLLRVTGRAPISRQHWNRAVFVIDQLERALPSRFRAEIAPDDRWRWPDAPHLNVALTARSNAAKANDKAEHILEMSLVENEEARANFSAEVEPVGQFRRQLPVGMFEGPKASTTHWTPGGASQVDLWTASLDGETIHLFELKAHNNKPLGMLPQAIYYARLLHHLRVGLDDGRTIAGTCLSLDSIRRARRIRMWLAGPHVHPLLRSGSNSPLEWLNAGFTTTDLRFDILLLEVTSTKHWSKWCWESRWPAQSEPAVIP
jgi:hypothetical protein